MDRRLRQPAWQWVDFSGRVRCTRRRAVWLGRCLHPTPRRHQPFKTTRRAIARRAARQLHVQLLEA